MLYELDDIIRDVRVCLDENGDDRALFSAGDAATLELNDIIRSKIEEAVRRVHLDMPLSRFESGVSFSDSPVFENGDGTGFVILPDDFMRLVDFKMSGWYRPVNEAITRESPMYAIQYSRHRGLRGTPERPVCAIVLRREGKVLEYFSTRGEVAEIESASYIPEPKIEGDGIRIARNGYRGVVAVAAALTRITLGDVQGAQLLMDLSKSMSGGNERGK